MLSTAPAALLRTLTGAALHAHASLRPRGVLWRTLLLLWPRHGLAVEHAVRERLGHGEELHGVERVAVVRVAAPPILHEVLLHQRVVYRALAPRVGGVEEVDEEVLRHVGGLERRPLVLVRQLGEEGGAVAEDLRSVVERVAAVRKVREEVIEPLVPSLREPIDLLRLDPLIRRAADLIDTHHDGNVLLPLVDHDLAQPVVLSVPHRPAGHGLHPHAVLCVLLVLGQSRVGLVDQGEPGRSVGLLADIRVVLEGKGLIGHLDLLQRGAPLEAQHRKVVDVLGLWPEPHLHSNPLPPEPPGEGPALERAGARGPRCCQALHHPPPDGGRGVHQAAGEAQSPPHRPGDPWRPGPAKKPTRGAAPRRSEGFRQR
mmetsp:Transcript_9264/g.23137  ORF Transcript_9264/g.23137 Transcript_9264/m.23137 type:complete len:371 (+) Transcript_9264:414-1526(+)